MADETEKGIAGGAHALPAAPRHRRVVRIGVLMLLTNFALGCYTTGPFATAPIPGQTLVMELNDKGRVALGPKIGDAATKVEGVLDSRDDSAYVVKVKSVVYLNGSNNRWSDEALTVQSDLVRELRERKFSRSRTGLLTAGTIGLAAAFIASRNLLGFGAPDRDKGSGEGTEQ